jgi:hypothetical protein
MHENHMLDGRGRPGEQAPEGSVGTTGGAPMLCNLCMSRVNIAERRSTCKRQYTKYGLYVFVQQAPEKYAQDSAMEV